jgi:hypothetical protein
MGCGANLDGDHCLRAAGHSAQRLDLPRDLYAMTQILRLHLFAKTPVLSLFFEPPEDNGDIHSSNQLLLFE